MSRIMAYKNRDRGPAWCAEGAIGEYSYYAGADTLDELKALIAEAAEESGVHPEVVLVDDPEAEDAPIAAVSPSAIRAQ